MINTYVNRPSQRKNKANSLEMKESANQSVRGPYGTTEELVDVANAHALNTAHLR